MRRASSRLPEETRVRLADTRVGPVERIAVAEVLDSPESDRYRTAAADLLREMCGVGHVSLVASGSTALDIGALALEAAPGGEVIVPSFTYVTTASAFARAGHRIRCADVDPDTLTIDPESVARLLSRRTVAVVAVHYAGVACDLGTLVGLTEAGGVPLIEDNAHGLGGTYRGRPLGSFGLFSILSFGRTKSFTCGEGGAILSGSPAFSERCDVVTQRGTNRAAFMRGEVDRFEWVGIGTNADLAELNAAYLWAQLERRDEVIGARRRVWRAHDAALAGWARETGVRIPRVPGECEPACHVYHVRVPEHEHQGRLIAHLAERGVEAAFHYTPIHDSAFMRARAPSVDPCPVAEDVASTLVRIPCHPGLTDEDLARVHEAVAEFTC